MTMIVKLAVMLGLLGLTAGCRSFYQGEVTDVVSSDERTYENAQNELLTVRVDVRGRDTVLHDGGKAPEEIGIRYFSQVSITGADGRVTRFTVPDGTFETIGGKLMFKTRVLFGADDTPAGYASPEEALAAAWATVDSRVQGASGQAALASSAPSAGVDAMIGSVTTAAK